MGEDVSRKLILSFFGSNMFLFLNSSLYILFETFSVKFQQYQEACASIKPQEVFLAVIGGRETSSYGFATEENQNEEGRQKSDTRATETLQQPAAAEFFCQ